MAESRPLGVGAPVVLVSTAPEEGAGDGLRAICAEAGAYIVSLVHEQDPVAYDLLDTDTGEGIAPLHRHPSATPP